MSEICYKPLAPTNNNCTVFSPLGWWQNSNITLQHTQDDLNYLDHFLFCSRNPAAPKDAMSLPCLGEYGGTIDPSVVLGGFLKDVRNVPRPVPYKDANTAIITVVVNNR